MFAISIVLITVILIAIGGAHIAELLFAALVIGAAAGYGCRASIASEISKMSLAAIIARLENLAKEDAEAIPEEVGSVVASLRKHL